MVVVLGNADLTGLRTDTDSVNRDDLSQVRLIR